MRIPTNVIRARSQERSIWKARRVKDVEYLFTMSPYEAVYYISPDHTVVDGDYVDPNEFFPKYTMRGIDYAIRQNAKCHVAEQIRVSDNVRVGVIMTLTLGDVLIGVYAIRCGEQQDEQHETT